MSKMSLKAVPNKNAGFIILLTSIFTFFFFGEIRNLTTLCLLPLVNNGFSLSSFFLSLLSFLWIGAQFPQEKFLSYGRIFTLHYYFLLMCILFSSFYWLSTGFSWIYYPGCFHFIFDFSFLHLSFKRWRLVFWNSIHLEVASDSFCFLLYSSWLLVFILYVFELFFSFINLYCLKGLHFS